MRTNKVLGFIHLFRQLRKVMSEDNVQYKVNKPHKKSFLTTPFGRLIDDVSYMKLFFITFLVWLSVSTYFTIASYYGHGMNVKLADIDTLEVFLSAMYFAGVTLTTLGYGEISPLGFGRLVSVLTAVSGLTVIAVLIAKISSERQSSILLLLHTSDIERRMSEFVNNIDECMFLISKYEKSGEFDLLHKEIKGLRALVEIINKYMTFHINQSLFLEIGTEAAIKKLLLKFSECHKLIWSLREIAKANEKIESVTYGVSKKMCFIEVMLLAHNKAKGELLEKLDSGKLSFKHDVFTEWVKTTVTEKKIQQVLKSLPEVPRQSWPRHIHKEIARKLTLSNAVVIKCIDELKSRELC